MNYLINIRTKIREIRKKEGLTQAQFAEVFSISDGYLSEIEHGKKSMPIELLVAVIEKFGLSPNEFFMYQEEVSEKKYIEELRLESLIEKKVTELLQKYNLLT